MEVILYQDEENDNPHVQYFIEELDLHLLPKLVGFLVHNEATMDRVLNGTDQLTTNEVSPIKNDDKISRMKTYNAFSSKLTSKWLQNLKRLKITSCDAVEVIYLFEGNQVTSRAFDLLKELELYYLPNLIHIWFLVPLNINAFQNLQLLVLSKCQNLYLFSPRVAKLLVQLQKVYINRCENMEEVILVHDEKETENKVVFPQLKLLELQHMPNLRIFSSGIYTIELPSMESLAFNQCSMMECFSYGSLWTPMLKRIQINGSIYPISGDLNATMERYMKGNCDDIPSNDDNPSSTISSNSLSLGSLDDCCSQIISIPTSQCSVVTNEESNLYVETPEGPNYMKEFTFADLTIATRNFSSDNLLGEGGFGGVYKGWLEEKTFAPSKTGTRVAIAIKKLKPNSGQGLCEWQTEVKFLERQSHPNLVKFLGYCSEDGELLLVYEFIPGENLFDNIYKRNPGIEPLSWIMRIKIAIGAARFLHFLHTSSKNAVIHRDMKSSNIMFDSDYNGKIIDFGLATWGPSNWDSHATTMSNYVNISELDPLERLGPSIGDSHVSTTVKGTFGYMDPAYFLSRRLYVKSDVYSFGVVLLELMTGLRAVDHDRPESQQNLVVWLKPILSNKRRLKSIMDSRMEGQYSSKAMLLLAKLVSKCTEDNPTDAPPSAKL